MHAVKLSAAVMLLLGALVAAPLHALELEDAKRQGLVGEEWTGFIGAVGDATPEVQALVLEVNGRRRAEYQRIAQENNLTVRDVAEIAGRRLVERTPQGSYVRVPDRGWVQK
jgi:uncharacterized protein